MFFNYLRTSFEYDCFELFLTNPNAVSNVNSKYIMNKDVLERELKVLDADTIARRKDMFLKKLLQDINGMFKIKKSSGFSYKTSSL